MSENEIDNPHVLTVGEWVRARNEGEHVLVEWGYETDPSVHEGYLRLLPEAAAELALRIAGAAYMARGVEVRRIGIVVNPDIEVEDESEEQKQLPENLPS